MNIATYCRAFLVIGLATVALVAALQMSQAREHWVESIETPVEGTKTENAVKGAAAGGVVGAVAAAVIGGVGVVAMGTGIGAPAGVGLIAIASVIGASGGAVVGAATGTSDSTQVTHVDKVRPAYEEWQWRLLFVISGLMYFWAVLEFRALRQRGDSRAVSGQ